MLWVFLVGFFFFDSLLYFSSENNFYVYANIVCVYTPMNTLYVCIHVCTHKYITLCTYKYAHAFPHTWAEGATETEIQYSL